MSARQLKSVVLGLVLAASAAFAGEGWKAGAALPDLAPFGLEGTVPDLKGKVVVLDFWASWCGPCKLSFPVLEALNAKYKDQGLVMVGVCMDTDAAKMKTFLEKQAATFAIVRDAGQKLAPAAQIPAMPTTVIVGKNGVIREIHAGFNSKTGPATLEASIVAALKEGK